MGHVTGLGGIFFKAQNPAELSAWYQRHLGLEPGDDGTVIFSWRDQAAAEQGGATVWVPFPQDTQYFDPSPAAFMINYRVVDLNGLLAELRAAGVPVDDRIEEYPYGRFAWIMDPEGNRIELWEPAAGS